MDESIVTKFREEARKIGAEVHYCGTVETAVGPEIKHFSSSAETAHYLQELAAGGTIRTTTLPAATKKEIAALEISTAGNPADTALCISAAEAGIATTGSLLLYLSNPDERALTALATRHAVFLRRSSIVLALRDLSATLKEQLSGSDSNYLSITTGPSRTADIERVLTIGVHGPKELHIFILEGE